MRLTRPPMLGRAVCALSVAALVVTAVATPTRASLPPKPRPHPSAHTTTAATIIDVVVPLSVPVSTTRRVKSLALSHESRATRRATLRGLAPGASQRQAVEGWAQRHGFEVTQSSGWLVGLRGQAHALAQAFGTSLSAKDFRDRSYVTPRTAPRVPAELRGVADAPVGLDTRPLFEHLDVHGGGDIQVLNATPVRGKDAGASAGAGTKVGTLNLSGWHKNDLAVFAGAAGLPYDAGKFASTLVGTGHEAATAGEDDAGEQPEVALDAETIFGVAPAANQRMYFGGNSAADYLGILNQMALDGLQTASTSWGGCEDFFSDQEIAAMGAAIDRIVAAGTTFFAASGDSGAFGCSSPGFPDNTAAVSFPASWNNAVAVGGTSVSGAAPSYTSTAWGEVSSTPSPNTYAGSGSGGGCSSRVPAPTRQAGVTPCTGRAVPDIATLADPGTGFAVYDTVDQWIVVGGTSLAAPASAAGLAVTLANAGLVSPTGNFLDIAYSHPSAFDDVQSGNNGLYRAGTGFDLVTGLGSPDWSALGAAITGIPATPPTGSNEPVLVTNPTSSLTADVTDILPNGEAVTGYTLVPETSTPQCTTDAPPTTVQLPSDAVDGPVPLSLSTATGGSCLTVTRTVLLDRVAPSFTALTATYTTSPSFTVTWAGSDPAPGSGLRWFEVAATDTTTGAVRIDIGLTAARTMTLAAVAGHGYRWTVVMNDGASNSTARTITFAAPFDDAVMTSSRHLSGRSSISDFIRWPNSADYRRSHISSARTGATWTYVFTGKTLTTGVVKGPNGGYGDVYLDGRRVARLNFFASRTLFRQQIRLVNLAVRGRHRVTVKVVGAHQAGARNNLVYLDSITVAG